jgi:hypothetical protein
MVYSKSRKPVQERLFASPSAGCCVSVDCHGAVQQLLPSNHSQLTTTEASESIGCGNYSNAFRATR